MSNKITKTFLKKPEKKEVRKLLEANGFVKVNDDNNEYTLPILEKYGLSWGFGSVTVSLISLGTTYIYIANKIIYDPEGKLRPKKWGEPQRVEICDNLKIPQIIFNEDFIQMYKKYIEKEIRTLEITNLATIEFNEEEDDKEA